MKTLKIIVGVLLIMKERCQTHDPNSFPHDHSVTLNVEGDITLGALFPIHKQGESPEEPCGEIQKEDGIQPLEAMLFTLKEINNNPDLLPGISLGVKAFDSCDHPYYASERALELMQGFIARETNVTSCPRQGSNRDSNGWPCGDNLVGLIGPQTSPVAVQIATMGRLFHVPQVSYLSTSVALCNPDEYSYFFRTVPSDVHQAKAIVELMRTFGWQYASIVHSDTDYGETGYEALDSEMRREAKEGKGSLCLADPITIYNKHFKEEDYTEVVDKLLRNTLSRVVIVFADRVPAGRLLKAAMDRDARNKFVWIGSDAWASRESVVKGREEIVEGAIAVQPLRRELPGYNEYFEDLIRDHHRHSKLNPWFSEYYRCYHGCPATVGTSCPGDCSGKPVEFKQLYIHFVRDAVYALAYALDGLQKDVCSRPGLCPEFRRRVFTDLKHYLRHVSFKDVANNTFQFYDHNSTAGAGHDGPPRYSIITFKKKPDGTYDWQNVGSYTEGQINLDPEFRANFTSNKTFHFCRRDQCSDVQIKVQNTDDQCCWHCHDCTRYQFKKSEYECKPCPDGTIKTPGKEGCDMVEETYLNYTNPWAISALVFSCVGIMLSFVAGCVLWVHWETPVVKACGRELSMLLLLGTFLSFATTFFIVAKPSDAHCGLMRFGIGFCYTVCYSAIITKTNRVARIFASHNTNTRFTSPLSCLIIAGCLVLVELIILGVWLVVEPPTTDHITIIPGKRVLVCSGVDNSFMAGLVYPFILIIGATLYAFQTRKSPCGFNETRLIFFANTITSIHWVAYVPLYMSSTDHEIRAVILAFSLSLSSFVQISCLILPKLYTVLLKPEKNTRNAVMTHYKADRMSYGVPETPPNSVAVIADAACGGTAPLPPTPAAAAASLSAATHYRMRSPHMDSPRITLDGAMGCCGRTHTWSNFNSMPNGADDGREADDDFGDYQRARSSSVCRATQTSQPSARNFKRNKTVSLSVYSPAEDFRFGRGLKIPTFTCMSSSSSSSSDFDGLQSGAASLVADAVVRTLEQEMDEMDSEEEEEALSRRPVLEKKMGQVTEEDEEEDNSSRRIEDETKKTQD